MRIGVSGYFGYQNLGDEIFLKVWKEIFNDHEVFPLTGWEDFSTIDRVIIGGGDLLIPDNFTSAYWRPNFLEKPTFIYGIGVPSNNGRDQHSINQYAAFFHKCKYVSFRDINSKDWTIKNGIISSADIVEDMAWTYNISNIKFNKNSSKTIGISFRPAKYNWEELNRFIDYVATKNCNVLMIPLQPGSKNDWNDDDINQQIARRLKQKNKNIYVNVLPPHFDIEQRIKAIEMVDIYITQRMHGMVMALKMLKPTMTITKNNSNKFYRISDKFGLKYAMSNDVYEDMVKTFNRVFDGKIDFQILKNQIKQIEKESKEQLLKFKEIVLKG